VLPDRTPELFEVRKVYQRIETTGVDTASGRVRVKNDYDFRDLDFDEVAWNVEHDGEVVDEGRAPAPVLKPKQSGELRLPLKRVPPAPGAEAFLNVRYALLKDEPWAKAGHVVDEVARRRPPPP
jgi:beta-galactosidase